jgi:hypothetical protein
LPLRPGSWDTDPAAGDPVLGGDERTRKKAFLELQSHYLFADKFGRPAKGNDKGKVEGLVGYARRNFMVPIPHFNSWEAFNAHLAARGFDADPNHEPPPEFKAEVKRSMALGAYDGLL